MHQSIRNDKTLSTISDDPLVNYFGFRPEDQQRSGCVIGSMKGNSLITSQTINEDAKVIYEINDNNELKQKVCKRRYQSLSHKLAASQSEKAEYTKLFDTRHQLKSTDSLIDKVGSEYTATESLAGVLETYPYEGMSSSCPLVDVQDISFLDGPRTKDWIESYIRREAKLYREHRLYQDIEAILVEIVGIIERIGRDRDWRYSVVHINEADRVNFIASCALELDSLNRERKHTKHSFKRQMKNSFKKQQRQMGMAPASTTSVMMRQKQKTVPVAGDEQETHYWQTQPTSEEDISTTGEWASVTTITTDDLKEISPGKASTTLSPCNNNIAYITDDEKRFANLKDVKKISSTSMDGLTTNLQEIKSFSSSSDSVEKRAHISNRDHSHGSRGLPKKGYDSDKKTKTVSTDDKESRYHRGDQPTLTLSQWRSIDSSCSSHFEFINEDEINECLDSDNDSETVFKGDMDLSSLIDFAAVLTPDSDEAFFVCD